MGNFNPQNAFEKVQKGNLKGGRNMLETVNPANKNLHQTLDVEEDKAVSYADNVSAGGTRYIVGFKGGLKFYGQQSQISGHDAGGSDDGSQRIDYDNQSNFGQSQGPNRVQTADHNARAVSN